MVEQYEEYAMKQIGICYGCIIVSYLFLLSWSSLLIL